METNLQKLSDDWKEIDSIVLYGVGAVARICDSLFDMTDISISHIIDQDKNKQGTQWKGIEISSFESVKEEIKNKKIVIMTAHTAYNKISKFLIQNGLTEYRDFCSVGQFICEWFWNVKHMNCVYHVDMTITTRCNFKCKKCNMFIPYYKEQKDYDLEELKRNVDLLFARLDYIVHFGIIGGETLLSSVTDEILKYIIEKYNGKYGRITLTTNGSIIPDDELLTTMKKNNVHLLISDYTKVITYKSRFDKVIEKIKKSDIIYDVRETIEWCDFGFPTSPYKYNEQELEEHLMSCNPEWNGLNDGKFFYCNVSWSAEKSGLYKLKKEDYIDLEMIDAENKEECHKIVELSRGTSSFCRICGGCGIDNKNYVVAGEQLNNI